MPAALTNKVHKEGQHAEGERTLSYRRLAALRPLHFPQPYLMPPTKTRLGTRVPYLMLLVPWLTLPPPLLAPPLA